MKGITKESYRKEVASIAIELIEYGVLAHGKDALKETQGEALELLNERVEYDSWIIYTQHHLNIIQFSGNQDYYENSFGRDMPAAIVEEKGISALFRDMAYHLMRYDVMCAIFDKIGAMEYELEQNDYDNE